MRPHHRTRRASLIAAAALAGALSLAAQPATAAPTDTVFQIPVAGVSIGPTGFPGAGAFYMTATTDPDTPGVTRLGPYTGTVVQWRNVSTGESGTVYVDKAYDTYVRTGSGTVVASATIPDGPGYRLLAVMPGAGVWTVP